MEVTDNEAARRVNEAQGKLFQRFNTTRNHAIRPDGWRKSTAPSSR